VVQLGLPALAHGGAVGLAAELGLVVVMLALGVRVWWQSRRLERSGAPGAGDEAGVEEDDGDGERDGGLGDAEAEEGAPAGRR
jgi:hypothetical protein